MEIKQKHRKHALRKAVTAAVLAGTAFSSLGGFAGAVTTVKAEEHKGSSIYDFLVEKIVERGGLEHSEHLRFKSDEEILKDIREFLKTISVEELKGLVLDLDNFRATYTFSNLKHYNDNLGSFRDDSGDFYQNGLNLISLLIQEVNNRIDQNDERKKIISEKEEKLKEYSEFEKELKRYNEKLEKLIIENNKKIETQEEELNKKNKELEENRDKLADAYENIENIKKDVEEKEASVKDLSEKLETSKKNHAELAKEFADSQKGYEKELADKHTALGEAEKRNADLEAGNKELKENLEMAEGISDDLQKKIMKAEQEVKELSAQLEAEKEALEAEKAKLAEAKEANEKLSEERDAAKKEAEKVPELEEQVEKLVEEITAAKKEAEELKAKAEGLEKDFEAVKAEKEALEAEIAKLKEDHQKEVDALNALLADKEKMLKSLQEQLDKAKEEAMKNEQMSQEEKAKLQAELDKAKQELAEKIKDMPNKVAPQAEGKANAGQAAPNQNQNNQAQANQAKNANNLPSTGDKPVNPLLVASGLSLMIGAGAFVYAGKRKKG